jgi:hypothetical protein
MGSVICLIFLRIESSSCETLIEIIKVSFNKAKHCEELDGPAASTLRRAITEVKQRWSVIGWVTKNLLSLAPPCFGGHVKPLVPAEFAVARQLHLHTHHAGRYIAPS